MHAGLHGCHGEIIKPRPCQRASIPISLFKDLKEWRKHISDALYDCIKTFPNTPIDLLIKDKQKTLNILL
jgi:hypothetical protein